MARRSAPEVNAGSMADIAFLLLIFFLVTTTIETDSGINRRLPPIEDSEEDVVIKQRNIFTVLLNGKDQLLVEDELMDISELQAAAVEFLDNGAGDGNDWLLFDDEKQKWVESINPVTKKPYEGCSYCKGSKNPKSSINPDKAIISLKNERETSYAAYVSVQNEIMSAYNEVRNRRAIDLYGESFQEMRNNWNDPNHPQHKSPQLKEKIERIKKEYPQKFSEVE
tara:strand:- start:1 stop:672 length:672 start_codon:yes stop_codon:yes gene_type:complete